MREAFSASVKSPARGEDAQQSPRGAASYRTFPDTPGELSAARVNAVHEPTQAELDADLERRIEQARIAMTVSQDPESRRAHFEEMRDLIAQRSPERIEQMERERGLRP